MSNELTNQELQKAFDLIQNTLEEHGLKSASSDMVIESLEARIKELTNG